MTGFELPAVDDRRHQQEMARFAETAFAGDGPADLAFCTTPSPIGTLLLVATRRGLVRIGFESEEANEVLTQLAARISPAVIEFPPALAPVREQLDGYFAGSLRSFRLPLDRQLLTPFQARVLAATEAIPPGEVKTYGQVAAAAGSPQGARAAGRALGANPIPLVVPCHRVVAADGSLHGYAGGLDRKRFLLELERGAAPLF